MTHIEFKALLVEEQNGSFIRNIKTRNISDLPENDLLIKVHYSSLNYKDALSASGNKGVTRNYPHTPGIDAVGTIIKSISEKFCVNEKVIVTSYDLGMNTAGGFGQYISVPADWAIKLPESLTEKEAMILGTAGLTAGMSVLRLTEFVKPEHGKVVVSGATGGVGILSIAILSKIGYSVVAISGKSDEAGFLKKLGADEIISRIDFEKEGTPPLMKALFAGAIDTVGGTILENIIKSTKHMGVVCCCGNVASPNFNMNVFPFIIRGVSLIGIESQNYPMVNREIVWSKLANEWKPIELLNIYTEISLNELSDKIDLILKGQLKGRTIINLGN